MYLYIYTHILIKLTRNQTFVNTDPVTVTIFFEVECPPLTVSVVKMWKSELTILELVDK